MQHDLSLALSEFAEERAALRKWVYLDALPFWGSVGLDEPGYGFREHLNLDGRAADVAYKRLRVQARQIFVFSQAALLGWRQGLELAERGYEFIVHNGSRVDGSWARTLGVRGGVLDSTADLYDLAFVLFALAWFGRATGRNEPINRARHTLDWIVRTMSHPVGGFVNTWPVLSGARLQNPHMHLFEALLALHQTAADGRFIAEARSIADLFRCRFFDSASGTLGEFFTDQLEVERGPAGDYVEPGHHYEWVWLLDQYSRASGGTCTELERLYTFAESFGNALDDGNVIDVVSRNGSALRRSCRLWPQAEALKAHITMLRRGELTGGRVKLRIKSLLNKYFEGCPRGTWREHFDELGQPSADKIPSSSFYHIIMAFGELERLFADTMGSSAKCAPRPWIRAQ